MKKVLLSLVLVVACLAVSAQASKTKKAKRDTLYTITASKIHIVDGKPTNDFSIYNLKWADTLWNVTRDLDMEQPNLAIKNYRWYFYDSQKRVSRFERYLNEKFDRRVVYLYTGELLSECKHYQLSDKDTTLIRTDQVSRLDGKVSKIKVVSPVGKTMATFSYKYDEKGNEIKMKASMRTLIDPDSVYSRQATYKYNAEGKVEQKQVTTVKADKSKETIKFQYAYNKDGKLELTSKFDGAGKSLGKEELIYYSGRLSQRKIYDASGLLIENQAFRYRKFGASSDNDMY